MSSNPRFEFASGTPKGSELTGSYTTGQRGGHSSALDRSGSFRESNESRGAASGNNGGKPISSSDMPSFQGLSLDIFALPDQKSNRFEELKRVFGVSPAVTPENYSLSGGIHLKSFPQLASEEYKRVRASLVESRNRAKDRLKTLADSTAKLDKYHISIISRKRQRSDCLPMERSNVTSFLKSGSQMQKSSSDSIPQRLEDRTKSGFINKRVRSSMADMRSEGRSVQRQNASLDKDRDMIRAGSGGSPSIEDKNQSLPAGGDGWEKKMKRKRSVGPISNRSMDGEREIKQGLLHKPNGESRMRSCDGHGFRSGSSSFLGGLNKTDTTGVSGIPSGRLASRNDADNASHSNEKRDATSFLEKEKITLKANDSGALVGEPSSVKGKTSRVFRLGNSVPGILTSSLPRPSGTLESWEHAPGSNKFQPGAAPNNRKRAILSESSPSVTNWGGQRPQKLSRTRRTNLVSPVSNNDDSRISSEGLSVPDTVGKPASVEGHAPSGAGRIAPNKSHHFKNKLEGVTSPAGLSESEESGGGSKLKDKGLNITESFEKDQRLLQTGPNILLPSKKNNATIKDGVRRQGRSGRGTMLSRIGMTKERVESIATIKPLRGSRLSSDSKTGRPPTKKQSDRKVLSRPLFSINNGASDINGESDDDHGELLAAVNSAIDARYEACSSDFWKMMEPIFSFISSEDINFLKQQLMFVKSLDDCFFPEFVSTQDLEMLSSFNGSRFGKKEDKHSNGTVSFQSSTMANETNKRNNMDSNMQRLDWNERVIPWTQRLLAALVVEDDTEDSGRWDESCQYGNVSSCLNNTLLAYDETKELDKMETDIYSNTDGRSWKSCSRDFTSCNGSSVTNNNQSPNWRDRTYSSSLWREDDFTRHTEMGNGMHSVVFNVNGSQLQNYENGLSSFEQDYQNMSLNERVLAELHSIGLFPDMEMYNNEEVNDEIDRSINNLKTELYQQLMKKKVQLSNLEKSIEKEEGKGRTELEKRAMYKLIERACRKLMESRGTSGHKGSAGKISKQAALDFGKRILDRYHRYVDIGKSCFSESPYSDTITSELLYSVSFCEAQTDCRGSGSLERNVQAANQTPDFSTHSLAKNDSMWNRGKKRELLLDEVVDMSTSRGIASLGNSLAGGTKGKRSERERDQNKDATLRNGGCKASRSSVNISKGDRKNKTKPKQKTAQLSTANGVLGRCIESSDLSRPPDRGSTEPMTSDLNRKKGVERDLLKDMEEPIDLTNLPLPGMDSFDEMAVVDDLGGQGQDFSSWLGLDEESLPDHDLLGLDGLEIPMDDLNTIL